MAHMNYTAMFLCILFFQPPICNDSFFFKGEGGGVWIHTTLFSKFQIFKLDLF